jgi:pentatricopeptide repeat protein
MVYVKPTVHLSRFAGTALKSFTHGGAQTVVAASQASYAAQNTNATPVADHLLGRWRKAEKNRLHNVHHQIESARHASSHAHPTTRPESSQNDSGLEKYFDAWQKYQRNEIKEKEWQQFQFARRLEWQPPTTVPESKTVEDSAIVDEEVDEIVREASTAPALKRSYTTSALNDFGKLFGQDEAARAQANEAIVEEIFRSKDDLEISPKSQPLEVASVRAASISEQPTNSSPITVYTPPESLDDLLASEHDTFTQELVYLSENKHYAEIPVVFKEMLRAGVQQPSPAAYRALLTSALGLTRNQQKRVPKALEVYSDMLRRKVKPDVATFGMLIDLLAAHASESFAARKDLEDRLARYGGLEGEGTFMFRSNESRYTMLLEDSSLSIALTMFHRASKNGSELLPSAVCAALVRACAEQGRVEDMSAVYDHMISRSMVVASSVFPPVIAAYGSVGNMQSAVDLYDEYKALAVANITGEHDMDRMDYEVYAALIKAYGSADRIEGGLKFASAIQADVTDANQLKQLRKTIALEAFLPLTLKDGDYQNAFNLSRKLSGDALASAMSTICVAAADSNLLEPSLQAFDALAKVSHDLAGPAMAMLAMHVRNANVEAAEPYWRILESAPADMMFIEPTTMRAVALIATGQSERGLRQARRMFARVRDAQPESEQVKTADRIDEAIEVIGRFMLTSKTMVPAGSSMELLRTMTENGALVDHIAEHVVARFGPEQIASLSPADVELLLRIQAGMIVRETTSDIAGPARFGCLLENIVAKAIMPSAETETVIERTLINIDHAELSRLWNNYRYPQTPAFTPVPIAVQAPAFDESIDPYAARTDVKGSNAINELLERPNGRRMNEALTKFRNMRRVGRVPRMFTYGKLIEGAAKENNANMAHDILEMAKQDVPFDARYRVVRFGWQQILDHMVAGCLNLGRRDLAARYHQDMLELGFSPSANTFGLYITTLKENTKTFDEATEAVKIFHQAKSEGVEPSSFLYNALIGKLGKARRIDDCLFYFAEMRNLGVRPTSVTYGTIVNALCRVSDEKFAEEIFEEMESAANYKPRPAPYHSLMQYFLATKRDRSKVLSYYERMRSKGIEPTLHTYKLLIDAHATLEPVDMHAAEAVLADMATAGVQPEAVHYASLIHAKGCVQHDLPAARKMFDTAMSAINRPQPCLYQALFESFNANHQSELAHTLLADMRARRVEYTPYIANALIHGWTLEKDLNKAKHAFAMVPMAKREPSTYEAMVRACLAAEKRDDALEVVKEALGRGYPSAVAGKIAELVR